jgi:predicted ATPase/transcriptional regulator with XRE-family HTH domain
VDPGAAPSDFAVVLRRLRESRSLTQEELAERAGLTAKAVGALERGERRRPYPHTVRSLADGLGLRDAERAELVASVPGRNAGPHPSLDPPTPEPVVVPGAMPDAPSTPLIGRESELTRLLALLSDGTHRLVTLTGPGGVGKTRLALEVLAREGGRHAGGAVAVDLAAVRQPALVLPRVATALGLPELVTADPLGELVRHLRGLPVLLVLDNLEQLTSAAPTLAELVARCPDLVVLATSRAPLRVRAEHEVVLGPLATPETDDIAGLAASPAAALLLERAEAAGSPQDPTGDRAAALAALCRRLDGIPLALELAAAGLRLLTPATLLDRLERTGLDAGPRDLPERHRTMTSVLDWSMDLLEPEEVALFERLAVFSGGFSLDSVDAVAGDREDGGVLPALGALVDQSLVLRVPSPDGGPRFRLLEPVRQYAMQRLHASGLAARTADRHAAHFHEQATSSTLALEGADLTGMLDRLEADHANLRSAHLRLLELDRDGDAVELVGSIWLYLALRGHAREGLAWLERIGPAASDRARCRGLTGRLGLLFITGDITAMRREADSAVSLCRRVADASVTCEAMTLAGQSAVFAGDLAVAHEWLAAAMSLSREGERPWVAVHTRIGQAQAALVGGDLALAGELLTEVVDSARGRGNPFTMAVALNVHANVTELLGDERATAALLGEAVALSLDGRLGWTLGYSLPALASLAQRVGDPASAAWLFAAGAAVSAADAVDPTFPVSRALADRGLDATRAALGPAEFARHWDAGRTATDAEIRERTAALMRSAGVVRTA